MADGKKSSISRRSGCYLLNLKTPDKTAKRLKLSFQRTLATVTLLKIDRRIEASLGFVDVSETGAGVFTPELLYKGAQVELSVTDPIVLKVRGIVAWSIPVKSSIHGAKFGCRSGIQFVFDNEAEAQNVREFVRKSVLDPLDKFRADPAAAIAAVAPPASATPVEAPTSPAPADAAVAVAPVTPTDLSASPAPVVPLAGPVPEAAPPGDNLITATPVATAVPPPAETPDAAPLAEAPPPTDPAAAPAAQQPGADPAAAAADSEKKAA
jgi:hypothetical protein